MKSGATAFLPALLNGLSLQAQATDFEWPMQMDFNSWTEHDANPVTGVLSEETGDTASCGYFLPGDQVFTLTVADGLTEDTDEVRVHVGPQALSSPDNLAVVSGGYTIRLQVRGGGGASGPRAPTAGIVAPR